MSDKIAKFGENLYVFHCPGCEYGHNVSVNGSRMENGAGWQWNGSLDKPTFRPSILVNRDGLSPSPRCHSFVTGGKIQFLQDSTHKLAGKTVDLPDWND